MAQFSKLNLIVLGFVMAAALLSALLFSLTPALETLKASSPIALARTVGTQLEAKRLRQKGIVDETSLEVQDFSATTDLYSTHI